MEQSETHIKANKAQRIFLILIVIIAYVLRYVGHNWDHGFHFHPDERAIIMFADKIRFFDSLNPHFFSYGSLPIYILKGITQFSDTFFNTHLANYDGMLPIGRLLSVIWDTGTLILVFMTARKLCKQITPALIAAGLYATAFFPIQNSHFYVVDVPLNFFITLICYQLILFLEHPKRIKAVFIGILFGMCLAIKITPVVFAPVIAIVMIYSWRAKKPKRFMLASFQSLLIWGVVSLAAYAICMPYTFLDFVSFKNDMTQQISMNSDPYIFPFTLQYVGTLPYLYYLKNIVLWGVGLPMIALFLIYVSARIYNLKRLNRATLFYILFYLYYFIVMGRSAVKFMRYMLPLYPFIVICAACGAYLLLKKRGIYALLAVLLITASVFWNLSFMSIYASPQTRLSASVWINRYIQAGSTIAVEHWDDSLPVFGGEKYTYTEMTLYDRPDDEIKWQGLNQKLAQADYLIVASNRLYVPLQRLTDCNTYKSCYPITSQYYKNLFKNKLKGDGFTYEKVQEFAVYPTIPYSALLTGHSVEIDDQSADESFTVYDHPRIFIYRNVLKNNQKTR